MDGAGAGVNRRNIDGAIQFRGGDADGCRRFGNGPPGGSGVFGIMTGRNVGRTCHDAVMFIPPAHYAARLRGCLIAGAVGDALGAPVEFMSGADIERRYWAGGPRAFIPIRFGSVQGVGLITDDTQMTLFTVEGIIRASVRDRQRGLGFTVGVVQHAYLRWLDTQQQPAPPPEVDGWFAQERWLYSRRAPGTTCMSALKAASREQFGKAAVNNSKGCGAVMRSAPFGFLPVWDPPEDKFRFECATTAAGYTHGHPTGQLAARGLAHIIAAIVDGATLHGAVDTAIRRLDVLPGSAETTAALRQAVALADDGEVSRRAVESLGGGWVAEEALAISVYCALVRAEPAQLADALAVAVTHSGDSDSTGAICGNILGSLHGEAAVPVYLSEQVEGRDALLTLADDMVTEFTRDPDTEDADLEAWWGRYPGW